MSQEALGERIGIYSTQISALERGQENPGYLRLVELAEALETTVGDLTSLADRLFDDENLSDGEAPGNRSSA